MARATILATVAERIGSAKVDHTLRVAIDGIDAAGKTTLAGELEPLIQDQGRPVIRASIDGFHNPRSIRYRRGRLSPDGYFHDSFNLELVTSSLLAPLGPEGDGRYRPAIFDWLADAPIEAQVQQAPAGAILLFDGIFLARPELASLWDLFIFVQITFATCLAHALERDRVHCGVQDEDLPYRYETRYMPAQREYLARHRPQDLADIILVNDEPANPCLIPG